MKRKLLVAGLATICVACSAAGIAACAPDAPEAQEGTIYQTGVETFWVGVGKAYMTFEYAEEPETPEEGAIYGYVFNVNVPNTSMQMATASATTAARICPQRHPKLP